LHVSLTEFVLLALVAAAGGAVQGSIGFGQNLVLVPVVAIVVPEAVPGALVLLGIPLTATMALRERRGIDRSGLGWIVVGRVPGTVVGVVIVALVSGDLLATLAGSAVLAGVLLSLLAGHVPVNRETATTAGATAGVLGTTAAIDGPPLALLYQRHPGATIRATLAGAFLVGAAMSFVALAAAGQVLGWQLLLALALTPALLAGLACSTLVTRWVGERSLRPAVLTLVTIAGVAAIVRGLVSS
jgi:uncharacterized membrane protein YfcA